MAFLPQKLVQIAVFLPSFHSQNILREGVWFIHIYVTCLYILFLLIVQNIYVYF